MLPKLSTQRDLFGNISYKKQLWTNLWETKHRAYNKSEEHEASFIWLNRIQSIIRFTAGVLSSSGTVLLSQKTQTIIGVILNVCSISLHVGEAISSLETQKLEHKQASEKYKFIQGEIERTMAVKRSQVQFVEVMDIISTLTASADSNAPPIFFMAKKEDIASASPQIPMVPISPEHSVRIEDSVATISSHHPTSDYPVLSNHPDTKHLMIDANIGRYINDVEGHVKNVDMNCCYFVGMSEEDIISPSGFGWISRLHREDAQSVWKAWTDAVSSRSRFLQKYRFMHLQNSIIYCISEAYPQFSRTKIFTGMEGIILNVPKDVWDRFDINIVNASESEK